MSTSLLTRFRAAERRAAHTNPDPFAGLNEQTRLVRWIAGGAGRSAIAHRNPGGAREEPEHKRPSVDEVRRSCAEMNLSDFETEKVLEDLAGWW